MNLSIPEIFTCLITLIGFIATCYGVFENKFEKLKKEYRELFKELHNRQDQHEKDMNIKFEEMMEVIRKIDKDAVTHKACEGRRGRCINNTIETMKTKTHPLP